MLIKSNLGGWMPDMPDLDNPGVTKAYNVTPGFGVSSSGVTYEPLKAASLFASSAMTSRPLGTAIGMDRSGNAKVYAGDAGHLYKNDPTTRGWTDISRSGGYTTADGERWDSTQYGSGAYFVNYANEIQYIDMNVDLAFANATTLCKARHIATVGEFVVVGNTYDALDGAVNYRVRWSGLGLPLSWDYSQITGADFQDVYGFGACNGIVGDEAGWLLMQNGVVKMTPVGYPYWFDFKAVPNAKGCKVKESVISVEGRTYYLSDNGFYMLNGDAGTSPIGAGQVDQFFLADADTGNFKYMTAAADPQKKLIYWTYQSKTGSIGVPDRMIVYNYVTGKWSLAQATATFIYNAYSLPWTIQQLDTFGGINSVPASYDDPQWAGGNSLLMGMDSAGKIYTYTGSVLPAVIETQEQFLFDVVKQINPNATGDKTTIKQVRPLFDGQGATVTVGLGSRTHSNDAITWSQDITLHTQTQSAYMRTCDRFHRFRIKLSGSWKNVSGFQFEVNSAGLR